MIKWEILSYPNLVLSQTIGSLAAWVYLWLLPKDSFISNCSLMCQISVYALRGRRVLIFGARSRLKVKLAQVLGEFWNSLKVRNTGRRKEHPEWDANVAKGWTLKKRACFTRRGCVSNQNVASSKPDATFRPSSWMTTNCRFDPLGRWFHFPLRYVCLLFTSSTWKYVVLKVCTVSCNCVHWKHDKDQWWVKGASFLCGLRYPPA